MDFWKLKDDADKAVVTFDSADNVLVRNARIGFMDFSGEASRGTKGSLVFYVPETSVNDLREAGFNVKTFVPSDNPENPTLNRLNCYINYMSKWPPKFILKTEFNGQVSRTTMDAEPEVLGQYDWDKKNGYILDNVKMVFRRSKDGGAYINLIEFSPRKFQSSSDPFAEDDDMI